MSTATATPAAAPRLRPSLPVIVGTGLTGCAISRSLARAGIRHLLVGPPVDGEGSRLGESLNLEGSLDFIDYFPEFKAAYLAKTAVTAHVGERAIRCDLNMQRGRMSSAFYAALGYREPPDAFLHVDRAQVDAAIFRAVAGDPHCEHVDALVDGVDYDADADRVRRLDLSDGTAVAPITVFDATNHVRAVARHLGLEVEILGPAQRAVYGHLDYLGEPSCDDSMWHSTHVVRLDREGDGVDGLAWYIPLKGLASIGVGVDRGEEGLPEDELSDEELFERVVRALERRAIFPAGSFAPPTKLRAIPFYRHFLHDRAYGRNWLLAGGTFCLMWFAASAGISSGFAAAHVAPRFIRDPERYGAPYESLLKALRSPHGVFDWLRRAGPTTPVAEIERRADMLVAQSVLRLALSVRLRPGVGRGAVAGALAKGIRGGYFDASGICLRARAVPTAADAGARLAALEEILAVFAGSRPLEEITEHIADDVVVHIDRLSFRGRGGWVKWARHSRATWPFAELRFEVESHTYDPAEDRLEVAIAAVVRDRPGGPERRSPTERFVYRFDRGRVCEIWTSRRNYTFLYGDRFARLPGFAAHIGRLLWWNLRRGDAAADERAAAE
jgi:flavin-dependent dehydrogenase